MSRTHACEENCHASYGRAYFGCLWGKALLGGQGQFSVRAKGSG